MQAIDVAALHRHQERLRQAWNAQLYREFDLIAWQYKVKLKRPVIDIAPLGSRWGCWDPMSRTITLARELIEHHPWNVVCEILKHEMAHQLVSDSCGQGRHGTDFVAACRILGVAPWARRAATDLDAASPLPRCQALGQEEERLLRRVEKLLALAGSSNEHEALLAMQRVQELFARHDIERLRARRETAHESVTIPLRKMRIAQHISIIGSILAEHFFVRVIWCHTYDARDLVSYRSLEMNGTGANVAMAEYVYHFLLERLECLWAGYCRKVKSQGGTKREFVCGVLAGFRKKLEDGKAELFRTAAGDLGVAETTALVMLRDQELETFVRTRHPRLSSRTYTSGYTTSDTYRTGVEAGRRIVLNRPLHEHGGATGRLLPAGE